MNSEHFIKYLKNPKLLDKVTYDELSQLRAKYPYSHILHYLLFLKSQQSAEDLAHHKKNASIFAVDNTKLFEEIKHFQELEQKPTAESTMDDLFDLSEDENKKESTTSNNEVPPSQDSEETLTPPVEKTVQPRIIREHRYIPLDPAIYGTQREQHISKPTDDPKPVENTTPANFVDPPKEDSPEETISTQTDESSNIEESDISQKSNVFFIDALINRDNNEDRAEIVSNNDAYKEVTDTPSFESVIKATDQIISKPYYEEAKEEMIEETLEETIEEKSPTLSTSNSEIRLEITNEEDQLPTNKLLTEETTHSGENETLEVMDKDDRETKKSFDKWVKKNDETKNKKKSGKKKKKKKDKMPLNARESLQETENMASETLAELLVKQGRNKKAIKVYDRLCLIFPEKSNYFAQIIQNLKDKS